MPGLEMDLAPGTNGPSASNGHHKDRFADQTSPRSPLSPRSPHSGDDSIDLAIDGVIKTSIEQLYNNVCEMQSSDESPSRASFISYGHESRIDSELRRLAGDFSEMVEITNQVVVEQSKEGNDAHRKCGDNLGSKKEDDNCSTGKISARSSPKSHGKSRKNLSPRLLAKKKRDLVIFQKEIENLDDNPDLGPIWLKQAKEMVASGENLHRGLEVAKRAVTSFEKSSSDGKPELDFVMSLHVLAAAYTSLGRYQESVPILERAIEIPVIEGGKNYALAKFAGCMQLGDTYSLMGQTENSILCYTAGLEIQRQVLGENDPRVGETLRYLAEAHLQAMQFDEAEKLCRSALEIHKEMGNTGSHASLEEAADRRLMGLICDTKGDYENALEHYVLASVAMASENYDLDVASIDCSIGDAYVALARFDEAVFAYQKALAAFKRIKGETDVSVASVYVRLGDLHNKIGKLKDSRSFCENALKIYAKPSPGTPPEEIASGLIDISAIFQSMNDLERAMRLLKRALKFYSSHSPGQQNTIAGIEAQMGVIYYMMGRYSESYEAFKSAIARFRASGEKKSSIIGIALNQMGLACVQRYAINEAADLFEEARSVLEKECGPYHPDTLGVYSNLAGTYDAMGRVDDAIEILEYVVEVREEKLGTANPEVDDEKRRLSELLKEAGRARSRKSRSLVALLGRNPEIGSQHNGNK